MPIELPALNHMICCLCLWSLWLLSPYLFPLFARWEFHFLSFFFIPTPPPRRLEPTGKRAPAFFPQQNKLFTSLIFFCFKPAASSVSSWSRGEGEWRTKKMKKLEINCYKVLINATRTPLPWLQKRCENIRRMSHQSNVHTGEPETGFVSESIESFPALPHCHLAAPPSNAAEVIQIHRRSVSRCCYANSRRDFVLI